MAAADPGHGVPEDERLQVGEPDADSPPGRAVFLLSEALGHLEDHVDFRPALVALDRLKAELALDPRAYPEGSLELVSHARAIVDDDADAAYQELLRVVDFWIKRWPSMA